MTLRQYIIRVTLLFIPAVLTTFNYAVASAAQIPILEWLVAFLMFAVVAPICMIAILFNTINFFLVDERSGNPEL
jgi:hypothetical protein